MYQLPNISYLIFITSGLHFFKFIFANSFCVSFSKLLNLFYILSPPLQYFCFRWYILMGLLCLFILASGSRFFLSYRFLSPRKRLGEVRDRTLVSGEHKRKIVRRVEMAKRNRAAVHHPSHHQPPPTRPPRTNSTGWGSLFPPSSTGWRWQGEAVNAQETHSFCSTSHPGT